MPKENQTPEDVGPTIYRKIFCDIVRGYTRSLFEKKVLFIKHLTTHDQVDLEDIEFEFYNKARDRGVPTERESLDRLIKEKAWTEEDDLFIEKQTLFIEGLIKGKKQLMLKSRLDKQDEDIAAANKDLNKKLHEKTELLGSTCEKYAKQRVNDYYISQSFYKDTELSTPLYSEKEFEEIGYSMLGELVKIHNEQYYLFTEDNIQNTILKDFYIPYMPFSEDTMQFFGKPVCELTHNQLKLILYTRVFKSIFDQHEDIPDHIKKDPKALMDYASTSKKGQEELDKHEEKGGATTIVGATKQDYEYMGVTDGAETTSLHDVAKKKGGKLNMEDLMELTGS